MKRIYACLGIIAVILLLAAIGRQTVHRFCRENEETLRCAEVYLSNGKTAEAALVFSGQIERYRSSRIPLSVFINQDRLAALDATLYAARKYAAADDIEEALAETARAESQIQAIRESFFRML